MPLQLKSIPKHICILRLSAIGDVCHTLPVVRRIQDAWPDTKITWIIGKTEQQLIGDIDNIQFIVFDKSKKLAAYREVQKELASQKFDVLLHMQMSIRASLLSLLIKAAIKLGFDRKRAKDLQWLFSNEKITHQCHQHVMDSLFGFSDALGVPEAPLRWDIPVPEKYYQNFTDLGLDKNYIVISPCSSKTYRNWSTEGYIAIAKYINDKYRLQVVLTGGNSELEKQIGHDIESSLSNIKIINLVAKTDLKQLLAILDKAVCVISPDSGPAHMATTVNTPVIGLYATTNPERARPYLSKEWVVSKYPEAIKRKYNTSVDSVKWGTRVRDAGTMDLISTDDVKMVLDKLLET